jgi:hypothetical protein
MWLDHFIVLFLIEEIEIKSRRIIVKDNDVPFKWEISNKCINNFFLIQIFILLLNYLIQLMFIKIFNILICIKLRFLLFRTLIISKTLKVILIGILLITEIICHLIINRFQLISLKQIMIEQFWPWNPLTIVNNQHLTNQSLNTIRPLRSQIKLQLHLPYILIQLKRTISHPRSPSI